jgi:hypothetical protein
MGSTYPGPVHQSAGHRDALPLTTGQLVGVAMTECADLERVEKLLIAGRLIGLTGQHCLQPNVLGHRKERLKVVGLEHEPEGTAAQRTALLVRHGRDHVGPDLHLTRCGKLQATQDTQQRGLSTPARPHDRQARSRWDRQRHVVERPDRPRRRPVGHAHPLTSTRAPAARLVPTVMPPPQVVPRPGAPDVTRAPRPPRCGSPAARRDRAPDRRTG